MSKQKKDPSVLQGAVFLLVMAILSLAGGIVSGLWLTLGIVFLVVSVALFTVGFAARAQLR